MGLVTLLMGILAANLANEINMPLNDTSQAEIYPIKEENHVSHHHFKDLGDMQKKISSPERAYDVWHNDYEWISDIENYQKKNHIASPTITVKKGCGDCDDARMLFYHWLKDDYPNNIWLFSIRDKIYVDFQYIHSPNGFLFIPQVRMEERGHAGVLIKDEEGYRFLSNWGLTDYYSDPEKLVCDLGYRQYGFARSSPGLPEDWDTTAKHIPIYFIFENVGDYERNLDLFPQEEISLISFVENFDEQILLAIGNLKDIKKEQIRNLKWLERTQDYFGHSNFGRSL